MLLQLNKISQKSLNELSPSFNNLPETDHLDGTYRLRRYSVVQCNGNCVEIGDNTFLQTDEYNKFQGNVARKFEPIESDVISSVGMLEMCSQFGWICGLSDDQKIDVHQMRVVAQGEKAKVSPEGVHQDGYDYICIVSINRHNILGGRLLLHTEQKRDPFFSMELEEGVSAMIDDRVFWHNATDISPIGASLGYMDAFVLTAR